MTPCEERGWKEGQVFEVVSGDRHYTVNGCIAVLDKGADTDYPSFVVVRGLENNPSTNSWNFPLKDLKRIYPPEEKSKNVDVVCEGKTTTLTREDAEKLNLC